MYFKKLLIILKNSESFIKEILLSLNETSVLTLLPFLSCENKPNKSNPSCLSLIMQQGLGSGTNIM